MSDSKPAKVSGNQRVVPVLNEATSVSDAYRRSDESDPAAEEIVITDGGSTDKTTNIVEHLLSHGAPVRLLREKFSLPGRGRNVGVANPARMDRIH